MKLTTRFLLTSAIGLSGAASAQAADLPFRKAAPVEYVRVCDWTGAGYFYLPGTDTCLKIGGAVRGEYAFIEPTSALLPVPGKGPTPYIIVPGRSRAASGFFARGKIEVDTRTQTAYGTLRAYVRIQADRLQGNYSNSGNGNGGGNFAGSNTYLDKGFIQFAGFTAGRVQSFFDFYADNYNFEGLADSDTSSQVFAYTATFGGGFSATIAAEDTNNRIDGIGNIAFGNGAIGAVGPAGLPIGAAAYGGERIPDAVAVLRVDQVWGAAQISAAYHELNTLVANAGGELAKRTGDGFAVQGGIQIKLPMLAAGDDLWINGGYQEGAFRYQSSGGNLNSGFNGTLHGGFIHNDVDAVAVGNGAGGYSLQKGRGFSVAAALHHYFTPQFHDVLFGSYQEISYGNIVRNIDWTRGGIGDGSEWRIGNQFIFTPVHNLDIGVEILYAHLNQTLAHEIGAAPTALPAGIARNPSTFEARLRMERDF
jgi:hypothetical protein